MSERRLFNGLIRDHEERRNVMLALKALEEGSRLNRKARKIVEKFAQSVKDKKTKKPR